MKLSRSAVLTLASLVLAAGCATSRYAGLAHRAPSAAELAVVPTMSTVPQTRVTAIRGASGELVGSEETVVGYKKVVTGFMHQRGGERVDEQDFYELARDAEGLDAVERARARGKRMNRTGLILLAAGTAAAITVPIVVGREAAPYAVGQWFVSFPIGLGLAMFGAAPFKKHLLPAHRAFGALGQDPAPWAEGR